MSGANCVITQHGLDYVMSANDHGMLVSLEYFVPIYDYRIDPEVHDQVSTHVSAFSDVADPTASAPFGEIIWDYDTTPYSLSNNSTDFYIVSAGGGNANITLAKQSIARQINTKGGTPLSNMIHGTSMTHTDTNPTHNWFVTGYSQVAGDDSMGSGYLYPTLGYYPVANDNGNVRGTFKCGFGKNIGSVKYNKIALYAVRYIAGVKTNEAPVFFCETYLNTTIYKTDLAGGGFDDMIVDFELDLVSIQANWSNVFFSSSADYWSKTPGSGLYFPQKIGIGEFFVGNEEPDATLQLMPPRNQLTLPQLKVGYDIDNWVKTRVDSHGFVSTEYHSEGMNLDTKIYVASAYDAAPAMYPDGPFDLGIPSSRWRDIYCANISAEGDVYAGRDVTAEQGLYVAFNNDSWYFSVDASGNVENFGYVKVHGSDGISADYGISANESLSVGNNGDNAYRFVVGQDGAISAAGNGNGDYVFTVDANGNEFTGGCISAVNDISAGGYLYGSYVSATNDITGEGTLTIGNGTDKFFVDSTDGSISAGNITPLPNGNYVIGDADNDFFSSHIGKMYGSTINVTSTISADGDISTSNGVNADGTVTGNVIHATANISADGIISVAFEDDDGATWSKTQAIAGGVITTEYYSDVSNIDAYVNVTSAADGSAATMYPDSPFDIGTADNKWRDIYCNDIHGNYLYALHNVSADGDVYAQNIYGTINGVTVAYEQLVPTVSAGFTNTVGGAGVTKSTNLLVKKETMDNGIGIVTLTFGGMSALSDPSHDGFIFDGTPLSAYRPTREAVLSCVVYGADNGGAVWDMPGSVKIGTDGSMKIGRLETYESGGVSELHYDGWVGDKAKGIPAFSVSYPTDEA